MPVLKLKKRVAAQTADTASQSKVARSIIRAVNNDDGMSTAEYAVGTVAAAGFGGLLIKLLSSPDVQQLLWGVIQQAFSWVF